MRGDCGYGNQDIIDVCEQRGLPRLLRLRKTTSQSTQGWQAIEDSICLSGSSKTRRVIVLRRRLKHDIAAIGQLYRDRCDCENGFDELKNQLGWGGFTTQDMHRCQITAHAVALVYIWCQRIVGQTSPPTPPPALAGYGQLRSLG